MAQQPRTRRGRVVRWLDRTSFLVFRVCVFVCIFVAVTAAEVVRGVRRRMGGRR